MDGAPRKLRTAATTFAILALNSCTSFNTGRDVILFNKIRGASEGGGGGGFDNDDPVFIEDDEEEEEVLLAPPPDAAATKANNPSA